MKSVHQQNEVLNMKELTKLIVEFESWGLNAIQKAADECEGSEPSGLISMLRPWIERVREQISGRLRNLTRKEAFRLHFLLNSALDLVERSYSRCGHPASLVLMQFDGLESILIGLTYVE